MIDLTAPVATVVGASVAALFGLVSGGVSSWITHRAHDRKRSDELFGAALAFLDHGSQRRNVGLTLLRLYMRQFPTYDKDICVEVLVGTATYLLLESKQQDRAHERLNLKRIMKMLLEELPPCSATKDTYQSLAIAFESRTRTADFKPAQGLWIEAKILNKWKLDLSNLLKAI